MDDIDLVVVFMEAFRAGCLGLGEGWGRAGCFGLVEGWGRAGCLGLGEGCWRADLSGRSIGAGREDGLGRLLGGGEASSSSSEKLICAASGCLGFVVSAARLSRFRLKVARFKFHSGFVGRIGLSMLKARLIEAAEKHLNNL